MSSRLYPGCTSLIVVEVPHSDLAHVSISIDISQEFTRAERSYSYEFQCPMLRHRFGSQNNHPDNLVFEAFSKPESQFEHPVLTKASESNLPDSVIGGKPLSMPCSHPVVAPQTGGGFRYGSARLVKHGR